VGLPVYNGERYLAESIESILGQTFADFELIICDNASTDASGAIARAAVARDQRVRYLRSDRNLGAIPNHNLAFKVARGAYFKWAAADDLLAPTFLERCVAVLDANPEVVLCHSQVKVIDAHSASIGYFAFGAGHASSPLASARFRDTVLRDRWCYEIFGLIRGDALRRTGSFRSYVGSDRVLRAQLALLGRYHEIPEPLFANRDHRERSIRVMPAHHLRGAWCDSSNQGKRLLPHWRILHEYRRCIGGSPISRRERALCHLALARWLVRDANAARLAADVLIAAAPGVWPWLARVSGSRERWLEIHRPGPTAP
jgi:glycosyltransferase involved in cell wall biosynthesis